MAVSAGAVKNGNILSEGRGRMRIRMCDKVT